MARAPSSIVIFLRQSPSRYNSSTQTRKLNIECKDADFNRYGLNLNQNEEVFHSVKQHFTDVAKEVAQITRTKARWEQTLLSDFPSFNLTDPQFFFERLRLVVKLNVCEGGLVQDAVDVFVKFKDSSAFPSIVTWNSALLGCLNVGNNDLFWNDGQVLKGYELLREVLENGLVPRNVAFNALISGFCEQRNFSRVSELLHIIIAKNCTPDIYRYQEVIHGLCKSKMSLEAFRVFKDLKDRGYALNRVVYTMSYWHMVYSHRLYPTFLLFGSYVKWET
ncbi:pentatricopeptide repeat-containing protein, putative [Ricinus communis]|uniref:Pentatricopeptide repeat-containing protein, putative n=1 Tax=Ricinus communis TaxID=3988 RepID=B9RSU1_RICCO|nr:pentatricopeptide repeat-containing protein, putative [Ricinus communis]